MELLTRSASVRERLKPWRDAGKKIAWVPTSGSLHKGHMSLVAQAQERADRVVVSVVSNLFEPVASLIEADRELLQKVDTDVVFVPPVHEIYPLGSELSAVIDLPRLSGLWEGAGRPGHMARQATVLTKLMNIVRPDMAVFGERDYQQLIMMRQLVEDLYLPVAVIECPTFRESNGLAFATANRQLTVLQRSSAPRLHATLRQFAKRIDAGERDYPALEREGLDALRDAGFTPEYFAVRQAADLEPVRPAARELVLLAAAVLGSARLVDNVRVRLIERR